MTRAGKKFYEKSSIDPDKNHTKNLFHEVPRNDTESPSLDPERNFKDSGKIFFGLPDDIDTI